MPKSLSPFFDSPNHLRWLFNGDSITHGVRHTNGHRDYTQLFSERLRSDLGRPGDLVINSAASGNTTRDLLQTFPHRVEAVRPDVVFLMIGMNDAAPKKEISLQEFQHNLSQLGQLIENLGAIPVFQTPNPVLPTIAPTERESLPDYLEVMRRVATDHDWQLIDHWMFWQNFPDRWFHWLSDAFHPNEFGHRVFYRFLLQSLQIDQPQGDQQRFFIPGMP